MRVLSPLTVYFDTNVFDHLYKRVGVSEIDLAILCSLVDKGAFTILLSLSNLVEALSALEADPRLAIEEYRLILSLADWRKVLQHPLATVTEDIRRYAKGRRPSEPFLQDRELLAELRRLWNPTEMDVNGLLALAAGVIRSQKQSFMSRMDSDNRHVRCVVYGLRRKLGLPKQQLLSFDEYWKSAAPAFAGRLAQDAGVLNACKRKGIPGLLEIRSVLLYTGARLSLCYAQVFEGLKPKRGDLGDLEHAMSAAPADIFVTEDGKLARLLSRVPGLPLQVLNLPDFLEHIKNNLLASQTHPASP